MLSKTLLLTGLAAAALLGSTMASAGGVITNGSYSVGIGANGELYDNASGIGFRRLSDGYDPLAPGTPRDSWGIATSLGSAWADQNYYGTSGITGTTFTQGVAWAKAVSTTSVGASVTQLYGFVAPNIVKVHHVVTNTSGNNLGFSFQRNWDVDVSPTTFYENSYGHIGVHPFVLDSSYGGFENPDPAVAYALSCAANCNALGDLGGGIKAGTWYLNAGGSFSFNYFYGISNAGEDSDHLTAQMFLADSDYNILSQSSENGQYPFHGANSAAIGFNAVPEPASWALMIVGFGMVGAATRRRRAVVSA
jgi:hypothetical protein